MTTTIEKIIYAIYPEYRAVAMLCAEDIEGIGRLIEKRVSGSGDAVIVYGFDKKERLINGQIGTILNTPGIF